MPVHRPPRPPVTLRAALGAAATEATRFYRRPGAAHLLLLAAVLLFYVGSVPVYYVHAVLRGEQGPRIDHLSHYLLDATLVFVGLTPALALVLPLAHTALRRVDAARPAPFTLLSAVLVTAVTAPGPLLHQLVAGRGTALAHLAESAVAPGLDAVEPVGLSSDLLAECAVQVAVGLPLYLLLLTVAVSLRGRTVLAGGPGGTSPAVARHPAVAAQVPAAQPGSAAALVPAQRSAPLDA